MWRVKPHSCDQYGKRFARSSNLKCHLVVHSGVKPYACDQSEKCFARLSGLKTHQQAHTAPPVTNPSMTSATMSTMGQQAS
ncbi:hypothetical protein Z043_118914 [Scleropages formosus]|uniref:C2H2-type domain-containing protein n=1 Tax=Scleropages formosus TaxID=113540 RepID=A0A0P7TNR2_SCLFO|nr:hypothetical protein Z043_118914 [Scleropages formosus]